MIMGAEESHNFHLQAGDPGKPNLESKSKGARTREAKGINPV